MVEDLAAVLANEPQASVGLEVVERSNLQVVLSAQELEEPGIVRRDGSAVAGGQNQQRRQRTRGVLQLE